MPVRDCARFFLVSQSRSQPEQTDRRYRDLSFSEQESVCKQLCETLDLQLPLVWVSKEETRTITHRHIQEELIIDSELMHDLIEKTMNGDDAGEVIIKRFNEEAYSKIEEAMSDYDALPQGYRWEVFGL